MTVPVITPPLGSPTASPDTRIACARSASFRCRWPTPPATALGDSSAAPS